MSWKQFDRWLLEHGVARKNGRYYIPCAGSATKGESGAALTVTIATRTKDRHGDILEPAGADTSAFQRNPVVLWAHQYDELPIGRASRLWSDGPSFLAEVLFDTRPFAQEVLRLYREGFLSGWSVGFLPKKWEVIEDANGKFDGYHIREWELVELSAVPVPANPEALTHELENGGIRAPALVKELGEMLHRSRPCGTDPVCGKGAILYKETPKDPEGAEWDAAEEVGKAEVDDLKIMSAWFDSANAQLKQSYKLPHHRAANYHVVWNGVRAAMGALFGARGGVDIPDEDREPVYRHLAKHYQQFDKEPPAFKAVAALNGMGHHADGLDEGEESCGTRPSRPEEKVAPEVSAEALADALFPLLWEGLREWAEQAAAREIRRRQGRLD
jgi:HK97 family phage prohead protease